MLADPKDGLPLSVTRIVITVAQPVPVLGISSLGHFRPAFTLESAALHLHLAELFLQDHELRLEVEEVLNVQIGEAA